MPGRCSLHQALFIDRVTAAEHEDGNGAGFTGGPGPLKIVNMEVQPGRSGALRGEIEVRWWAKRALVGSAT